MENLAEELSALAHEQWAGWMIYLFSKSIKHDDGSVTIPAELVCRWQRQVQTKYQDLSEDEKNSDRQEAIKVMTVVLDNMLEYVGKDGR